MTETIEELEKLLGPAENFIATLNNSRLLRQWAIAIGTPDFTVYSMSNIELTNLYHARAGQSNKVTDIQRVAAEIFTKVVETVQHTHFDTQTLARIIRHEIENVAPRKLEVTSARGTIILDGLVHYATDEVIKLSSRGQTLMLVGPAGCGKTTIGAHTAKALQLPFYITGTINETHELKGFVDGHGVYHRTPFRNAFENGGVWVADEIDAWDASALLAANAALANGYCDFPDSTTPVNRHPNFRMIAAANTYGHGADRVYIGRNQLDAASLDRFGFIDVDYDLNLEQALSQGNTEWLEFVWKIRKAVLEKNIRHVVSTRAIVNGVDALAAGLSRERVEAIHLFKGMSENDREKLKDDDA